MGDYCDILRCHEYQEKAPIGAASTGCTPATLEKRKFECKVRNCTLASSKKHKDCDTWHNVT